MQALAWPELTQPAHINAVKVTAQTVPSGAMPRQRRINGPEESHPAKAAWGIGLKGKEFTFWMLTTTRKKLWRLSPQLAEKF